METRERPRTVQESACYFEQLAIEFEKQAHRISEDDPLMANYFLGKAEAYKLSAFEITHNMVQPDEKEIDTL